jgi:hypothetical protein
VGTPRWNSPRTNSNSDSHPSFFLFSAVWSWGKLLSLSELLSYPQRWPFLWSTVPARPYAESLSGTSPFPRVLCMWWRGGRDLGTGEGLQVSLSFSHKPL